MASQEQISTLSLPDSVTSISLIFDPGVPSVAQTATHARLHAHATWRHTVGAIAATSQARTLTMASRQGYATATAAATSRNATSCARCIVIRSANKSGV